MRNFPGIFRSHRSNSQFLITRQYVRYWSQGRTIKKNAPPVLPLKSCCPDEKHKPDKLIGQSDIYCRLITERHSTTLLKRLGFPIPIELERLNKEKGFVKIPKQEYKVLKNTTCPPRPRY